MKAIMISIRPEWVAKILNGEKTIEIRKRFPKDYVGWVYIYVTKQGILAKIKNVWRYIKGKNYNPYFGYQGKVVARFWCDKVEEIRKFPMFVGGCPHYYLASCETTKEFYEKSCLDYDTLYDYLKYENGYAIHITKLEIFDKPKEIKEFRRYCDKHFSWWTNRCLDCKAYTPDTDIEDYCNKNKLALTKAPQSWCYVEI